MKRLCSSLFTIVCSCRISRRSCQNRIRNLCTKNWKEYLFQRAKQNIFLKKLTSGPLKIEKWQIIYNEYWLAVGDIGKRTSFWWLLLYLLVTASKHLYNYNQLDPLLKKCRYYLQTKRCPRLSEIKIVSSWPKWCSTFRWEETIPACLNLPLSHISSKI